MQNEGAPFTGTLYAGLMWTNRGPKVLEFNVRFGDPETEVLMPLIDDVAGFLRDAANGRIPARVATSAGFAAAVVIAARGYPDQPETGVPVEGLRDVTGESAVVFHGGTRMEGNTIVSSGGRILTVGARGGDLRSALDAAYDGVRRIRIEGSFHRGDIGRRHLTQPTERTNG
jgi:phosphoribosylamine--glycine ligase